MEDGELLVEVVVGKGTLQMEGAKQLDGVQGGGVSPGGGSGGGRRSSGAEEEDGQEEDDELLGDDDALRAKLIRRKGNSWSAWRRRTAA